MALVPNSNASADSRLGAFERYLLAERNVSENTRIGYMLDLAQLVTAKFGADARPPYDWSALTESDARAYLIGFTKDGAEATTVRRKLAAARTFCRFLQRDGVLIDNPFGFLRGPRKAKRLPKSLSVEDVARFLAQPMEDLRLKTVDAYTAWSARARRSVS